MTLDPAYHDPNTQAERDPLERALAALSAPRRGDDSRLAPELWKHALGARNERSVGKSGPPNSVFARRVPNRYIAIAASILLGLFVVGTLLPTLGKARSSVRVSSNPIGSVSVPSSSAFKVGGESERLDLKYDAAQFGGSVDQGWRVASSPAPSDTPRYVARKASIDLKTHDVAGAFSKAAFLVSDAQGEYIENSSLTGRDDTAAATLLLRIRPERLSEVLNGLRKLGEVTSETTGGDDVTDRVVDLDSRIRNEQRIERELLELVDKRPDAPLKELLDLRAELSKVRDGIEQLQSQRDRLGRLVSLASVLVNIRSDASAVAPVTATETIGDYFKSRITSTFRNATRALVDSLTFLLGLFIAGAFWWILIIAAAFAILRIRKAANRKAAHEPPPTT